MVATIQVGQPKIEIEKRIGNTTYIVNGFYAPKGVTVSEKSSACSTEKLSQKVCKNGRSLTI